jgi:alpha-L-arabinofuranosidase
MAMVMTSEKATDENTLGNPTKVSPVTTTIDLDGPVFHHRFPPNSVTILRIKN